MLHWKNRNKRLINVITFILAILLIRFRVLSFPYTSDVKAFVYRDGKWSESILHMDLNYKHKFFAADEFTGSIYLDDLDIMKYWKDYSRFSQSAKKDAWNVKELVYNVKNSFVDGEYQNSVFNKNYTNSIGKIYYKDFLKSIVIAVNDYKLERKDGINYVDTSEIKPVIIAAGNVSLDDIKKIKEHDIALDNVDRDAIDDINIKNNIKMPIFKIELRRWNEGKEYALEEEYKDFDWRAPSSFVSDEDFNKTFNEVDEEEYIKEKIAELENFKSGFINEVKLNKKAAHKEDDTILTEAYYDIEDGRLYSVLLMKRGDSGSGYIVQSVYTIKIDKDGKQEFISDKLGVFSN